MGSELELLLVYWFTFLGAVDYTLIYTQVCGSRLHSRRRHFPKYDSLSNGFCTLNLAVRASPFFSIAALNGSIQMERYFKSVKQLMPYYFALAVFGISALGMFYLCR